MNFLTNEQKLKIIDFLKKNKLIILPTLCILVIVVIVLLFSQADKQAEKKAQALPTVTVLSRAPVSTTPLPAEGPGQPVAAEFEQTWDPIYFSDDFMSGMPFEKKQLPNGSVTYTYASDNPTRPDMIMVKDGLAIFKRMIVLNVTTENYVRGQGKPDYIARGSVFWGPDAITYLYFKKGIAFVASPKTNMVFEQITFQPVSPRQYKQVYGEDLVGDLSRP